MKTSILAAMALMGCFGTPPISTPSTPSITGDTASTAAPSCDDDFTELTLTTSPAAVCPGGGLPSDLIATLAVGDAAGATCGVCDAGDLDVRIWLANPCTVDVEVTVGCPVLEATLAGPELAMERQFECYTSTATRGTQQIPPGAEIDWFTEHISSWSELGPHTLAYALSNGIGSATAWFCLQ